MCEWRSGEPNGRDTPSQSSCRFLRCTRIQDTHHQSIVTDIAQRTFLLCVGASTRGAPLWCQCYAERKMKLCCNKYFSARGAAPRRPPAFTYMCLRSAVNIATSLVVGRGCQDYSGRTTRCDSPFALVMRALWGTHPPPFPKNLLCPLPPPLTENILARGSVHYFT